MTAGVDRPTPDPVDDRDGAAGLTWRGKPVDVFVLSLSLEWWARDRVTGAAAVAGDLPALFQRLAEALSGDASSETQVGEWLAAVAGAPDADQCRRLVTMLAPLTPEATVGRWHWLRLGATGPAAWAAGMSLEEAQAHRLAGTLDAQELTVLAGLRGWRFPPLHDTTDPLP